MAATINLTNGSTTVSLTNTSGFELLQRGWMQNQPGARAVHRQSILSPGRSLVMRAPDNVVENIRLVLQGSSEDNIATQIQNLYYLIDQARLFQTTDWQQTPVYLEVKTDDETNTRYSLVKDGSIRMTASLFDCWVTDDNTVNEIRLSIEREPYWRSHAPESLPTALDLTSASAPGTQADETLQIAANYRGSVAIDKIFNYDDNLAAFSGGFSASNSFTFFEVSGSTPAVDDIIYFGADEPFFNIILNIGTPAVVDVTFDTEYWDGATWSSVTGGYTYTDFGEAGLMPIKHPGESDWAKTTINTQNLFWIRVRITAFTSWTTSPTQTGQIVYTAPDDYIEIAADQIDGDADALALIRAHTYLISDSGQRLTDIIFGVKSRGLTNFTSRLNAGGSAYNPGSWSISYGSDTGAVADERGPDGMIAQCTFAGTPTDAGRVSFSNSDEDEVADFEGTYYIYARVEQVGGSDGDVFISLETITRVGSYSNEAVYLTDVSNGIEVVALGLFEFGVPLKNTEDGEDNFDLELNAGSDNGSTPTLNIFDLVLIPVDEYAGVVREPDFDVRLDATSIPRVYDIDGGVLREGSVMKALENNEFYGNEYATAKMIMKSELPMLPPDRQMRIYFLVHDDGFCNMGMAAGIKVYCHEQWAFMRGAE